MGNVWVAVLCWRPHTQATRLLPIKMFNHYRGAFTGTQRTECCRVLDSPGQLGESKYLNRLFTWGENYNQGWVGRRGVDGWMEGGRRGGEGWLEGGKA